VIHLNLGDVKLSAKVGEILRLDRTINTHKRQFVRVGCDDYERSDLVPIGLDVDLGVLVLALASHSNDAIPRGRLQLRAYSRQVRLGVLPGLIELEAAHVDTLQVGNELLGLLQFLLREFAAEAFHGRVSALLVVGFGFPEE